MPCDSSHMISSQIERELSKVYQLLDELDGVPLNIKRYGDGYDSRAYNRASRGVLDKKTRELCERLQSGDIDVTRYSLELQMWWRDHQIADAEKAEEKKRKVTEERKKKLALAKLTKAERELLELE